MLNEADTRAKLIDPKLRAVGWGESQIEREHYFLKGKAFTAGRIYLVGEESRRRQPRRVDYLLRLHNALPIAILEAKDESHTPDAGLEQAKAYALALGISFAYSSNGHRFVEFDFFRNRSRVLAAFPTPEELLRRWEARREYVRPQKQSQLAAEHEKTFSKDPLLQPACPLSFCGKELHYFQEVAIQRVLERVTRGQRRILLTMATGTGKTFTAFQIVWKLKKSGWLRKPVLFLADRIVLRDQAYNAFAPFADGQSDPRGIIQGGKVNLNRDLYFALYQALDSDEGTVMDANAGALIVGASISALIGFNEQQGPLRTNWDGRFRFPRLPAGTVRLSVGGAGYRRRQVTVETIADTVQTVTIELKPETGPAGKIEVRGLTVTIADEATFLVEGSGDQLTLDQYLDYTRKKVIGHVPDWARLHEVWTDPAKRGPFLEALETESVHVEVLAEVLAQPRADQFDLLAHIAFGKPIHTRDERTDAFVNYEQRFLEQHDPKAREVILALLDKYRLGGVSEMASPDVFRLSPFREMGQAPGIIQRFGGAESLRTALGEMQRRLYRKETA
jgi:type I site-specific restriction endonuclease